MRIYSNAIFGKEKDKFVWRSDIDAVSDDSDIALYFQEDQLVNPSSVSVKADANLKQLTINSYYSNGPLNEYTIVASQDPEEARRFISEEYKNERVAYNASNYLFGKKIGHILRNEDKLPIGTILLDCHDDVLHVQANALFSEIELKKYAVDEQQECYKYTSPGISDDVEVYFDSSVGNYVLSGFGCHSILQDTDLKDIHLNLGVRQSDNHNDYPTIETVYSGKLVNSTTSFEQTIMMFFGVKSDSYWNLMFHDNNTASIVVTHKTDDDYTNLYSSLTGFSYLLGKVVNAGIESMENRFDFNYYVSEYDGIILSGNVGGEEKQLVFRTYGGSQTLVYQGGNDEECILQRISKK